MSHSKIISGKTSVLILFAMAFLFTGTVSGQTDSLTRHIKEVGWTIKIPPDFTNIDSASLAATQLKGEKMIEASGKGKMHAVNDKKLVSIWKGKSNRFFASFNYSPNIKKANWEKGDRQAKELMIKTFVSQLPNAGMDTTSLIRTIDGVDFKELQATVHINHSNTLKSYYLSCFYRDHYFVISYFFLEKAAGEEIEEMLNNSKFEK